MELYTIKLKMENLEGKTFTRHSDGTYDKLELPYE